MMEWLKIKDRPIDWEGIYFLLDGNSVFIHGTPLNPYIWQLCGKMKLLEQCNFTPWFALPLPPNTKEN